MTNETVRSEFVNEKLEIVSRIDERVFENYPMMSLQGIINAKAENEQGMVNNLFKTRFSVLSVQPLNLYEVCQLVCNRCTKNFSFKDGNTKCATCQV